MLVSLCFSVSEDSSVATVEVSDSSSILGEFEVVSDSVLSSDLLPPDLEQLTQEVANKGPQQSEVELRFVHHTLIIILHCFHLLNSATDELIIVVHCFHFLNSATDDLIISIGREIFISFVEIIVLFLSCK